MDINGVPAIVTGGASGLGQATAERLAANGAKVTILDLDRERRLATAAAINGHFVAADVTGNGHLRLHGTNDGFRGPRKAVRAANAGNRGNCDQVLY